MGTKMVKKYALIVITLASFLTPFMGSAINLAIPAIGRDFNSNTIILSWVATSYILASAAFLVPFGRLSDIIGRKRIFLIGITVFFIFTFLCGLAWSIQVLIIFRIIQGVGSAMIFSTGMAILSSAFPPQERGKVLGINVATVYVGLSLGPVLGGTLNHHFGWQAIFFFTSIIALVVIIISSKLKTDWTGSSGESFDYIGSLLYIIGFISFMYGISSVTTEPAAKAVLLAGFVLLIVFGFYEMRIKYPVLNLSLFKNVTYAFSNLAALINYSATFSLGFLLSLYFQEIQGYDSQITGMILLAQPVIMAVLSPITGALSDRVEPRILATLGMAITTLGLFFFCFLSQNTSVPLIVINLVFLGTGFALFSSPNSNAVMGSVEKRYYGIASSTLGTMRLTGQAVSMAIVTLLMTIYLGNAELTPALRSNLMTCTKASFAIFSLISFGGIFASWARGKRAKKIAEAR
ncbi:MAG: MFS transporter [Bacillota bacterium]|jgi:EmrB/QacA subfamily drug resistance transporter|nr:MFS transporter [Clostridia bacterium]